MVNTSKPQVERRGNYVRDMAFGRWRWLAEGGRPITEEVQVGNWILKPDGTRVHITARQANKQTTRQTNEQAARKANTQTIGQTNTQTTKWDDMQAVRWANRQTINTQSATDKQNQNFDGYYIFPNPQDPNNSTISQEFQQPVNTNQAKRRVIQRRPNYTTKVAPKRQNYWNNQYQNFLSQMTDDQKKWLESRGIDYTSAEKMQTYLNNLGQDLGKGGIDNKWGNASQTAWNNFVATTMKNNPLQTPVEDQPVIDAPDPFGYKTSNHYDDGMALKGLGFNNYAGLQAYAKTSEDQFAKDLKQRFGNDVSAWNQTKVEGDLGVSGKYRGGRIGDFGDMARSMAAWAGTQNSMYEQKQNNARMDAARQQYANKLAQQYTPQLPKPSLNKPMIGNIGINTIGNQPGLSDIWAGPDGLV